MVDSVLFGPPYTQDSFETAAIPYERTIYKAAMRLARGNKDDAADLVQETLSLQTLPSQTRPSASELRVDAHGFSLHAAARWRADQRKELEQLCRYITRPAIANQRLKRNRAGQVVLQLKSPYKDGTTHIVMEPLEFMERLAALVPRPRLHLIRFHGVLAPNAKWRSKIIPSPPEPATEPSCDDRARAGCAGAHELGPASQTGLRHRHRTVPELRRCLEDHHRYRRSAGDYQNPHPSGPADPRPAALPGAAVRSFPNDLRAETGCQRNPSPPLALSSSARRDGAPIEHFRAAAPPEPAEAKPRFSPNSCALDTLGSSALYLRQKKRWFKFPIHKFSCKTG